MVTCLPLYLVKKNTYVIIVRHAYRDARALHGQLAMYVLKQYTLLIHHCLFYVYVNVM